MTAPYVVALDPGSRRAGLAVLERASRRVVFAVSIDLGGRNAITVARVLFEHVLEHVTPEEADLVSEWPRKYASHRAAWDDLDDLRFVVKTIEQVANRGAFGEPEPALGWRSTSRVAPGTWKRQVPKHIHHARVGKVLADAGTYTPDAWTALGADGRDAVCLGLWFLDRPSASRGTP